MGFKIPNASGLTYPDQAAPDQADFDIVAASSDGYHVASGCAVTASGSSLVLTVAAGQVRFGLSLVTVAGNTATVTTAHATLGRYDLVVVDAAGTASIIAGTAAAAPAFPAFTPTTQVVLAVVYVPATATTLAAANLVDKRMIVSGVPGELIDNGQIAAAFDIQAVGTTLTEVPGGRVIIPPRTRPYALMAALPVQWVSGTAAAVSFHTILAQIWDETAGDSLAYVFGSATYVQVTAVTKSPTAVINLLGVFEPNSVQRTYTLRMALSAAAVAGWTSTWLRAGNLPQSGQIYPPVNLLAVGL